MKNTTLVCKVLLVLFVLSCQTGLAQTSPASEASPNFKALRAYYTAFEKKDWNLIAQSLADGFTFTSPLDDHIPLETFRDRCWPNAGKIKRFDLEKVVIKGDDAFVIYNGWTNEGKLFRNSDYFTFKDGKIKTYECFFGPGVNYPNSGK